MLASIGASSAFAQQSDEELVKQLSNPVIALTAPSSPLGAALIILPAKDFVLSPSVIDGGGTAPRPGFDTMFEGKTSYIAEGRLTTHLGGKTGHQLLGLVYGRGSYGELEQSLRAFIPRSEVREPLI